MSGVYLKTRAVIFLTAALMMPGLTFPASSGVTGPPVGQMTGFGSGTGQKGFRDALTGMEFIFVKGGCFQMGAAAGESVNAFDQRDVHEVCVDDFYLGKYEVTQKQWVRLMGGNPSTAGRGHNYPADTISWNDAQAFLKKLSQHSGHNYRLPTEAEWEFAARSGGKDERFAGTDREEDLPLYAWYRTNARERTHSVGQKKPNGLGFHDMSGNVWEWCSDWYDPDFYRHGPRNNPTGPSKGVDRVKRGGSWTNTEASVKTTIRSRFNPTVGYNNRGFRAAVSAR